ncbi:hypothetical protein [Burkholderia phage vB_BglM_WTB]
MAASKLLSRHLEALKALDSLNGRKVEAGWFESARYPSGKVSGKGSGNRKYSGGEGGGMLVSQVMRIMEYGATITRGDKTITIPARPAMRYAWSNFQQNRPQVQSVIARNLIEGKITAEQALGNIGIALEGEIVRSIRDGPWTPNSKATVRAKGFDKPLIDTSIAWQSVSSKVS